MSLRADGQNPEPELVEQTWTKVQYFGGGENVTMDPNRLRTWQNSLTISPKLIHLRLKDGQAIRVKPNRVTAVYYIGKKYRREVLALEATSPILAALVGRSKSTTHFIGIEYLSDGGHVAGLLLRAHKDNHAAIFAALKTVTKVTEAQPKDLQNK
jgi:hypothetical protein